MKDTIDDIFTDDDLGLLGQVNDLDIFKFKHTPKPHVRAEADFVAQRKPMKEKDFARYESNFLQVHKEIAEGKRKMQSFQEIGKNLHVGNYYIVSGIMCYLESVNFKKFDSGKDGRTRTIFENGTYSNMLYRSLGKQIQNDGKLITNT